MSVEFNDESNFYNTFDKISNKSVSGLAKWLVNKGISRDEKGANNLMILVTIICFSIAIFFALK